MGILYLQNNRLTGEIPAELGDLEELVALRLSDNLLTGEIPPELADLDDLAELYLKGNLADWMHSRGPSRRVLP